MPSGRPQASIRSANDVDHLIRAFTLYTESVIHTSTLMFQRSLVQEKAGKQQVLKDRWRKHYHSFIALAEDHDRVSDKAASATETFDNRVRQYSDAQEKVARALMSSIVDTSAQANPLQRELDSLKGDVQDHRAMLHEMRFDLIDLKKVNASKPSEINNLEEHMLELTASVGEFQSAVKRHERLLVHKHEEEQNNASKVDTDQVNKQIKELAQTIPDQKLRVQNVVDEMASQKSSSQIWHENWAAQSQDLAQNSANQKQAVERLTEDFIEYKRMHEAEMTRQETQFTSLTTDFTALKSSLAQNTESQKQDVEMTVEDSSGQNEHLAQKIMDQEKMLGNLIEDFAVQKENLEQLKVEITGDNEKSDEKSKGLIDYIREGTENNVKVGNALQALDKEVEGFAERLQQVENGLVVLGSRGSNVEPAAAPNGDTASLAVEPGSSASFLRLEERLKELDVEQEKKDDYVSFEVERLDNILLAQEKAVKDLKKELCVVKHEALSTPKKPPTPPPPVESQGQHELLRLKLEQLEKTLRQFTETSTARTDTIEVLVESQQQRFDNLSTEHMANCIIHQMQSLYPPHPGNLYNKIDQITNKQQSADLHILNFMHVVNQLTNTNQTHSGRIDDIQTVQIPLLDKKIKEATKSVPDPMLESNRRRDELKALTENYQNLQKSLADISHEFNQKLDDLRSSLSDRLDKLGPEGRDSLFNLSNGDANVKPDFNSWTKNVDSAMKRLAGVTTDLVMGQKDLEIGQKDSRLLSHDLRHDLEDQNKNLENVRNALNSWKTEHASTTASINTVVEAIQTRLDDVEATIAKELASLHGSLSILKNASSKHDALGSNSTPTESQTQPETQPETQPGEGNESDAPLALKTTLIKPLKASVATTNEKSRKRKRRGELTDESYISEDSDPPISRPTRKSNRGIQPAEKDLKSRLRASSDGGETRG